jgi:hypothetical protein
MINNSNSNPAITSLETMINNTCFCKLREQCKDKNSPECMRHRNLVAEFMADKHNKPLNKES